MGIFEAKTKEIIKKIDIDKYCIFTLRLKLIKIEFLKNYKLNYFIKK